MYYSDSQGGQMMKTGMATLVACMVFFSRSPVLLAQDGAGLYKSLCASCHDSRKDLQRMSPERVLAAMETGSMISMASGRTTADRRGIAQFITAKSFARPLVTTPSRQAMCP